MSSAHQRRRPSSCFPSLSTSLLAGAPSYSLPISAEGETYLPSLIHGRSETSWHELFADELDIQPGPARRQPTHRAEPRVCPRRRFDDPAATQRTGTSASGSWRDSSRLPRRRSMPEVDPRPRPADTGRVGGHTRRVAYTFGLSPVFGLIALFFLAEVVRGRPPVGGARRSTSLARAFLFGGLAINQVALSSGEERWASPALFISGLALFVGALCVWIWQGWNEGPRTRRSTATEENLPPPSENRPAASRVVNFSTE